MAILALRPSHPPIICKWLASKGVLNVSSFCQSNICCFWAMTLLPLHLVLNWPVFTSLLYSAMFGAFDTNDA